MSTSRTSDSQLELLMNNLPGMAYFGSAVDDRPMTFVSDGCKRLTGYSKTDFESHKRMFSDLIHGDDLRAVRETIQLAVQACKPFELEYRIVTNNQQERWVCDRGRVYLGIEKGNSPTIEGFVIDVTERKVADIALIQNHAFFESVLDTVEEGLITFDNNGEIETANLAMHKLFGYNPLELVGQNIDTLIPSLYLAEQGLNSTDFKDDAASRPINFSRDCNGKRSDGVLFPIFFCQNEIKSCTLKKFVGLVRDRSFQVEVKKENLRHIEQLAHIDRMNVLGEMAAGIAHEINQPLTAISLFAQAGKRLLDAQNYDLLYGVFEKLSGHALRAGDVIERMQSMAKPGEHHREVINCSDMIRETVNLAKNEAHLLDIEIEISEERGLPCVEIDRIQIQQVVLNLLRNAVQSIASQCISNSRLIKLELKLNDTGEVKVLIVDSGAGVDVDIIDTLFIPFATSKTEGMGMGLSICQAIIIEHGGQLDFYNNVSGGATFFFTLSAANSEVL
jgi:two-component system sensor kinase FixL